MKLTWLSILFIGAFLLFQACNNSENPGSEGPEEIIYPEAPYIDLTASFQKAAGMDSIGVNRFSPI